MTALPDIEIYFQGIADEALSAWLSLALSRPVAPSPRATGWSAVVNQLTLRMIPKAQGAWSALNLSPAAASPWADDEALATALSEAFPQARLRYADAPWREGEDVEAERFQDWRGGSWQPVLWKG